MADLTATPIVTTTETTTTTGTNPAASSPTAPPQPATLTPTDKERILSTTYFVELIKNFGLPTAFCVFFLFGFLLPMRDGHLKYLDTTGNAIKDQGETMKSINKTNETIAASNHKISDAVEKVGDAVDGIQAIADETKNTNMILMMNAKEHFEISKETHTDVQAIKASLQPKPSATKKTP